MDLHIHSVYSDGIDEMEQIVHTSINSEIDVIGFTDHLEYLYDQHTFEKYVKAIMLLRDQYKDKIKVLIGGEINCLKFLELSNSQRELLNTLDYLLIEDIEYLNDVKNYFDQFNDVMTDVDFKIGIAHLDLKRVLSSTNQNCLRVLLEGLSLHNMFIDVSSHIDCSFYTEWTMNEDVSKSFNSYNFEYTIGSDTHDIQERNINRLREINSYGF